LANSSASFFCLFSLSKLPVLVSGRPKDSTESTSDNTKDSTELTSDSTKDSAVTAIVGVGALTAAAVAVKPLSGLFRAG
jgi:hypothetical protein